MDRKSAGKYLAAGALPSQMVNLVLLTKLNDHSARLAYAARTFEHGWSRAVLAHHIEARTIEPTNLVHPAAVTALGAFDVIVCRNVLIYFNDDTTRRVETSLAEALRPGGHLLIGVSEPLLRLGTSLHCEERGGAFFYTRAP